MILFPNNPFPPGYVRKPKLAAFCRRILFPGNVDILWRKLDADGDGYFTPMEFCPDEAMLVFEFRTFCTEIFGSLYNAYIYGKVTDLWENLPRGLYVYHPGDDIVRLRLTRGIVT